MTKHHCDGLTVDVKSIRLKSKYNQQKFWARIGVTQSAGSRYESGLDMPLPVQKLFKVVHVNKINIEALNADDLLVISYLRAKKSAALKKLRSDAAAWAISCI